MRICLTKKQTKEYVEIGDVYNNVSRSPEPRHTLLISHIHVLLRNAILSRFP